MWQQILLCLASTFQTRHLWICQIQYKLLSKVLELDRIWLVVCVCVCIARDVSSNNLQVINCRPGNCMKWILSLPIINYWLIFFSHYQTQHVYPGTSVLWELVSYKCQFSSFNYFLSPDNSTGNWTEKGCKLASYNTSTGEFQCECNHLTNFAVLVVSLIVSDYMYRAICWTARLEGRRLLLFEVYILICIISGGSMLI